jgi:hypothetical protein
MKHVQIRKRLDAKKPCRGSNILPLLDAYSTGLDLPVSSPRTCVPIIIRYGVVRVDLGILNDEYHL